MHADAGACSLWCGTTTAVVPPVTSLLLPLPTLCIWSNAVHGREHADARLLSTASNPHQPAQLHRCTPD